MALPLSYNVRNLRVRWKTTLLAVFAIGIVVGMFIFMVSIASGFRKALAATGVPENAIVVQKGATSELISGIGREEAHWLMADDRIARNAKGDPLASPEIVVIVAIPRKGTGTMTNVLLRGVSPMAYQVRHGVRVLRGRFPTPGLNEIMVGRRIAERYSGTAIGDSIRMQRRPWTVVGVFDAAGSGFESEIWGDVDVFAQAFNRQGGYQSITMRLKRPEQLAAFATELASNPRLRGEMKQERKFYTDQGGTISGALLGLNSFVSIVMAIGAIFAAMNTMYAIVASRMREIGTLRALGFPRHSILISFVIESMLLASVSGVLGVLFALPFDGLSTGFGQSFAEFVFDFEITPAGIGAGIVFALAMGLFGGLLPAVRAARLPIVSSLRAS